MFYKNIQNLMILNDIDYYLIPSNDEFLNPYPAKYAKRIQKLTGFTGSFAIVILCKEDKSIFITDSRYISQAQYEINTDTFDIINISNQNIFTFFSEKKDLARIVIGLDASLYSIDFILKLKKISDNISLLSTENLVDKVFDSKIVMPNSKIFNYKLEYAGEITSSKIIPILDLINNNNLDYYLITNPESICWLLNIRALDLKHVPILLSYLLVNKYGNLVLFCNNTERFYDIKLDSNINIKIVEIDLFAQFDFCNKKIATDFKYCNYQIFLTINNLINIPDITLIKRACKNNSEIEGMEQAHIEDSIAFIKFWFEFENNKNINWDELKISDFLLKYRSNSSLFVTESFDTIAGFNNNAAIVHYHANDVTNKMIDGDGVLLIDSGGHYVCGTTDVTRTIVVGNVHKEVKDYYTAVLRGHIDLATSIFLKNTYGYQLDGFARKYLWELGADYGHGTGHGVGSCLNVHEGPQSISKNISNVSLMPGMVISNEPGVYFEGKYGIRIENLQYVVENNNMLSFKQLTLIPYDNRLIDFSKLSYNQINYLEEYYKLIKDIIVPKISENTMKEWLLEKMEF